MVSLYRQTNFHALMGAVAVHISNVEIVSDSRDRVRSEGGLWGEAESLGPGAFRMGKP